jgi:hypothetical protein
MKKVVVVLMQQLFLWYFQLCLKVQKPLRKFCDRFKLEFRAGI